MSYTKTFWMDALERASKSALQAVLTSWLVGTTAEQFDLFATDLLISLKLAVSMFVLSIIMSVLSKPAGAPGTASLTNNVVYEPTK